MATDNSQQSSTPNEVNATFQDRRTSGQERKASGFERRQFSNSYDDLSPEAAELGRAIDAYKLQHRRRFINYEEMLAIVKSLGYQR
jgi:hypothetical protein